MSSQHGFDVLGHTSWRRRLSRYGWEACKAETAVSETATASPWCSMFDDDPKAMSWLETLEDMEVYWAKGPGADINAALAGPLAGSIVQFMTYHARAAAAEDGSGVAEGDGGANGANGEDDEDNDQGPAWSPAVVRVAHAETVVPLVQALGIAVVSANPPVVPSAVCYAVFDACASKRLTRGALVAHAVACRGFVFVVCCCLVNDRATTPTSTLPTWRHRQRSATSGRPGSGAPVR